MLHSPASRSRRSLVQVLAAGLLLAAPLPSRAADPVDPAAWVAAHLDETLALYRHFHAHPELSQHEEQTAKRLAEELKKAGCEVQTGIGGHGLVGILKNGPGRTILVRGDMDALPVTEETGLPYASTVRTKNDEGLDVGVMHACGHDIHTTNLVPVAKYLATHRDRWSGTVVILGQPAEEKGAGALAMLDGELLKKIPRPDFAIALHVDSSLATGKVGVRAGYMLANVDMVDVTLLGRGGHGSQPHTTIDPVVLAALLIVDLQTIVAREIPAQEPAVVTVGSIRGGTKHNIISDRCHLQLTLRSYTDEVRTHLKEAVVRKAKAIALSHRAPEPKVVFSDGSPALFNDESLSQRLAPVLAEVVGKDNVVLAERSMGGEDFSQFHRQAGIPVFMYRLGSVPQARLDDFAKRGLPAPSLHSAVYAPDPAPTLRDAATTMIACLLDLLPARK